MLFFCFKVLRVKVNIIPDYCEAIIDFRLLPGQNSGIILKGLEKMVTDMGFNLKDSSGQINQESYITFEVIAEGEPSIWKEYEQSQELSQFKEVVEIQRKTNQESCTSVNFFWFSLKRPYPDYFKPVYDIKKPNTGNWV